MSYGFCTRTIHAGQPNDEQTGSVTFPIFQTSTYEQIEPGVPKEGYSYSRTKNPTRAALEENIAALEDACHGVAFSSGLAAVNGVLNLLKSGDHVVAGRELYGGSYRLFTKLYQKFGLEFTFIDTTDPEQVRAGLRPNTKFLWLESPSNPLLTVTDIAAAASVARPLGVKVVVDNTFASPYLQKPLELGADIVLHSTTKYLNGHSDVIGGCVVTNDDAIAADLRFFQNAVGAVPGPQDCFLTLRGIKTLAVRMARHCENALKVAEFLGKHESVSRVFYPGLPSNHPGHEIAKRQMNGFGGIVSFELQGGFEQAKAFAVSTRLFTLAESLGSVKSLLCHPATMTHASMDSEARRASGISDSLIRISVGLEDAEDLVEDLDQALNKAAELPKLVASFAGAAS